jgi:hypothetical protein
MLTWMPTGSRLILAGCLVIFVDAASAGRPASTSAATAPTSSPAGGDVEMFADASHAAARGSVYTAMGGELQRRHYPTASVLNWHS